MVSTVADGAPSARMSDAANACLETPLPATWGVSVVVCCHNAAERLPRTLRHLADQSVPPDIKWEVIVVDNASTDRTATVAAGVWPSTHGVTLRVVRESELGLSHARRRGCVEARYELVSFIDDDNWVARDWVETVERTMAAHPEVGVCGGRTEAALDTVPPPWFTKYQRHYACGDQWDSSGDVTWSRGHLWGAGMTLRKSAWFAVVDSGVETRLADRCGAALTSGGDEELCYQMRAAGWRLWFEPRLFLHHYMPAGRLNWRYLRRLYRGFGNSRPLLDEYLRGTSRSHDPHRLLGLLRTFGKLGAILVRRPQLISSWEGEGDHLSLLWEARLGRLETLCRGPARRETRDSSQAALATGVPPS